LQLPVIRPEATHVYYVFPLLLDTTTLPVSRARLLEALRAEGIPGLAAGYVNVHLLPMYQQKMAYGTRGFPWTSDICRRDVDYRKGICPVAERLHDETLLMFEMCLSALSDPDIDLIVAAFRKVWAQLDILA